MRSKSTTANYPIFIVGLPRSGSTLWSRVIGAHPDLAFFAEMHYLSVWHRDFRTVLRNVGNLSEEKNIQKLIEGIFSKQQVPGLKHGRWFWKQIRGLEENGLKESLLKAIIACQDRTIGALFKIVIEEATRCQGKNRAVVKFPVYPAYLGHLVEWWPEGKIIHISRDPRSLAASKTNDPNGVARLIGRHKWMSHFLPTLGKYFAVFQYMWDSHTHARFKDHPNYRLFLYEDLVSRPDQVIHELCEFCGIDFSESMLNPAAGQASSVTGQKSSGFDPSRAEGWKRILSPAESQFIKKITKSSMGRFGYTPDK